MKTECKIPELYLFDSSNRSTSGSSSHSWHSSISGFKDQTLAKFEEELLSIGRPKSLRGSLKRRLSGKSSRFRSKSERSESRRSKTSLNSQHGRSADSETSNISCYSLNSSTPSPPLEDLSNFAEQLSCSIIKDSLQVMFGGATTTCTVPMAHSEGNIYDYADRMAVKILTQVMLNFHHEPILKHQEPIVVLETEVKGDDELHSLSDEYADALDIPYNRLEEFADVLAVNVLQRSINVFKREEESTKRVSSSWFACRYV